MGNNRGYRKMSELMAALAESERALTAGTLGLEGLDAACSNARELYERLVVLRHKARESALAGGGSRQEAKADDAGPARQSTVAEAEPEPADIRLDTRPLETPHRQTSLIEAIEATQEEAPAPSGGSKTKAAPAKASAKQATLAEKLEKAPVADLPKAISLSHKFWFVAELFNGDRIAYEKTVVLLNTMEDGEAARQYVQGEVIAKLKKPADPEALGTFMDLIDRRFA